MSASTRLSAYNCAHGIGLPSFKFTMKHRAHTFCMRAMFSACAGSSFGATACNSKRSSGTSLTSGGQQHCAQEVHTLSLDASAFSKASSSLARLSAALIFCSFAWTPTVPPTSKSLRKPATSFLRSPATFFDSCVTRSSGAF